MRSCPPIRFPIHDFSIHQFRFRDFRFTIDKFRLFFPVRNFRFEIHNFLFSVNGFRIIFPIYVFRFTVSDSRFPISRFTIYDSRCSILDSRCSILDSWLTVCACLCTYFIGLYLLTLLGDGSSVRFWPEMVAVGPQDASRQGCPHTLRQGGAGKVSLYKLYRIRSDRAIVDPAFAVTIFSLQHVAGTW